MQVVNIDGTNHTVEFAVAWVPNNYQIALGMYEDSSPLTSGHTLINLKTVDLRNVTQVNMCTLLEGNCNADAQVNILDFSTMASSYLKYYYDAGFNWRADFDYSGQVNSTDASLLSGNYLQQSPQRPACGALLGGSPEPNGTVSLRLETPAFSISPGNSFSVAVIVDAGTQPVSAVDCFLAFDPDFLEVVAINGSSALPVKLASAFDNSKGSIDFASMTLEGTPPSGTFTLATIQFRAKAQTAGSSLTFSETGNRETLAAYQGDSILGSLSGATVVIQP